MVGETIMCFSCALANETTSRFCAACGAPLWAPARREPTIDIPMQALELWKNATDEWKMALGAGEPDILWWGHIESLLSLAISYAGSTPFPRAHAHLAIVLLTLEMDPEAEREANIALEQNPNEFRAQQVRIALALNDEKIRERHPSDLHALPHPSAGNSLDAAFRELEARMDIRNLEPIETDRAKLQTSTLDLVAEIERILAIFRSFCETNTDVEEYLNISDFLILLSDQVKEIPLELRAQLYQAVAYTPTDKLNCQRQERKVVAVLKRASRGLLSLKPEMEQYPAHRSVAFA